MESETLRNFLECPICTRLPSHRVFTCPNGHNLCEDCYHHLQQQRPAPVVNRQGLPCPSCKDPFSHPPTRNRLAESLIVSAKLPEVCSYHHYGCTFQALTKSDLDFHDRTCNHRPISCLISPHCEMTPAPRDKMIEHLRDDHQCDVIEKVKEAIVKSWERPRFKGSPPQFPYTLVYFDDETFGIHAACTGGFFYTWVECVSRKDVMNYFCKIVARSQDRNTQYTFRGPVRKVPRDPKISECLALNKGMWDNCGGFNSYKKDIFVNYTLWKEKEENLKHPMRKFMTYTVDPFDSD